MKTLIFLSILFCVIAMPTMGQTPKSSVETDIAVIKTEIKNLTQTVSTLDGNWDKRLDRLDENWDKRLNSIEKQISRNFWLSISLIGLMGAAIAIPLCVIAWYTRQERQESQKAEEYAKEIESLKRDIEEKLQELHN